MWGAALIAALAGYGVQLATAALHPVLVAAFVLGTFGILYFGIARVLGLSEAEVVMNSVLRRFGRRKSA